MTQPHGSTIPGLSVPTDGGAHSPDPSSPDEPAAPVLPEEPLYRLRASRGWVPLNLRELWQHRELLYFLTWRDVKVRYKQTVLGAAWAIIQPLFTMLVFWLFFGKLAGMPSDHIPYPLFALAGLLPWTFFANAVNSSGNSLIGSANLITKVYFPRLVIPASAVLGSLVDLAVAFAVLVLVQAGIGVAPSWQVVLLPMVVVLLVLLALGVGMWMAALNVRYRDIRYALPFLIQLWMFATPIIYPASLVPAEWRWVLAINPLTGLIEAFRACLFARAIDWPALGISATMTAILLASAAHAFRRAEAEFADVI